MNTKELLIINRIALLKTRSAENQHIIAKLERELRKVKGTKS